MTTVDGLRLNVELRVHRDKIERTCREAEFVCAVSFLSKRWVFVTIRAAMATYTAMADFSVGHCKAFVVDAAERAGIQFRVTTG